MSGLRHRIDPLPDWAVKRAAMMNVFDRLDGAKTALLVVDLQVGFMTSGGTTSAYGLGIVDNVNRLSKAVREAGGIVVFIRQTFADGGPGELAAWQKDVSPQVTALRASLAPGQPAHAVYGGLDSQPDDLVVDKYRRSAFAQNSSGLHAQLQSRGIENLIVAGAMTNVCCESTARDAYELGYRTVVVNDATAAMTDAEHNAGLLSLALCFADVRETESAVGLLAAGRECPSRRSAPA